MLNQKKQIEATIKKSKNIISWILRSFFSRSQEFMLILYKSLVILILEYCSVLWNTNAVSHIQRLEDVQCSFLRKIKGAPKNYWECLDSMKVYSLQRQWERYRTIYVWKYYTQYQCTFKENPCLGRLCITSIANQKPAKFRETTLAFQGTRLFNSMPKHIQNMRNVSTAKFKRALDRGFRLHHRHLECKAREGKMAFA